MAKKLRVLVIVLGMVAAIFAGMAAISETWQGAYFGTGWVFFLLSVCAVAFSGDGLGQGLSGLLVGLIAVFLWPGLIALLIVSVIAPEWFYADEA